MRILLIHGRSQGGNDPSTLKKTWVASLEKGLTGHGRTIRPDVKIDFPFYGDMLDEFAAGASLPIPQTVIAKGPGVNKEFEQFQQSVLLEMKKETRLSDDEVEAMMDPTAPQEKGPLNWHWIQAIAQLLDKQLTPLSEFTIETFLKDVFLYITKPAITKAINKTVTDMLTDEPTLMISHSLGTIVAYNVLRENRSKLKLTKFITVGSPLGISAISSKLGLIENPAGGVGWYNAYDERDIVALNPLDSSYFPTTPPILNNNGVNNHTSNRHGIVGYLNDAGVAATVISGFI